MKLTLAALVLALTVSLPALAQELPLNPANKDAISELSTGMELETLPGGYLVVAPSKTMLGETKTDPSFGLKLSRQIAVYAPSPSGGLQQVVAVRHDVPDREFALKVARLTARLLRLHKDRTGKDVSYPAGEEVAQVWLTRTKAPHNATAAAETRVNHVYLFEINEPRPEVEWARTIAHEWGHLTLLTARGFKEPEGDSAGYFGERLFLKWLREDLLALPRKFNDFCERDGLQLYYTRQIAPLMARYNASGPADKRLGQLDTAGMDYYIGMALDTDEVFGSKVFSFALYHLEDITPQALVNAVRNAIFLETELKIKLPAWVPLAPDTYSVSGPAGKVLLDVRPLDPSKPTPFKVLAPGFKRLKAVSGNIPSVVLRRGAPKK
ncbi:hypothetical protein [Armatimonas rosea]|uniref:Peptidase M61 catalytic domain-containing protein n=1 Tax=Armatimonas rosea TaxID=685828 RepID=A0A7W9SQ94_ARMRO|nr:hypothetical protein [Armatimonas rosea]MBB6050857.1 hypothetical protein [Armatimonas rosea]